MGHSMHLHGHHFQMVAIDGQRWAEAVRDTVWVPPKREVTIAFDANNPGRWAFHIKRLCRLMMLIALALVASPPSSAATNSGYVIDHGVAVYYAIVPAEVIKGHSKQHPEATMHGGVSDRPHVHHVMVALFNASTLERVVDANVTATVGEIGLAVDQKQLEPFTVARALTYGNYFDLQPGTDYRVRIEVKVPGWKSQARIEFEYRHE